MEMVDQMALCIPVERAKRVLQPDGKMMNIYYDREALRFLENLRTNAGWMKDIKVYFLCPEKRSVPDRTIRQFENYGVEYIEYSEPIVDNSNTTFISIPYTGYYFEQLHPIPYKYHLRLDLDFIIRRPPDKRWFDPKLLENSVIVGCDQMSQQEIDGQRRDTYSNLRFDTGFVLTNSSHNFYKTFWELCNSKIPYETNEWKSIEKNFGNRSPFFKEEFVVDYMYENKLANIIPYDIEEYEYKGDWSKQWLIHEHLSFVGRV